MLIKLKNFCYRVLSNKVINKSFEISESCELRNLKDKNITFAEN